jgi:hypothetical protein
MNGVTITPAAGLYRYRPYLETLLTYGSDAAASHLTNAFWNLDKGNNLASDPTASYTGDTNTGFIARWNRVKQSKEFELYIRLHSDMRNNPTHLFPGVSMQIKLTKASRAFYLMKTDADSKVNFKFLDAQLLVNRVRPNPAYLLAHNTTLQVKGFAGYYLKKIELKTFTIASGPLSLSIDNAVLGKMPKRHLFTIVKNTDFLGSVDTNPFHFRHYDMNYFALYVNGKQSPRGGIHLNMGHEKSLS